MEMRVLEKPDLDPVTKTTGKVIAEIYEAFLSGDADRAASLVTPDYVHHVPGRSVVAGEFWGPRGLRTFMEAIARHSGGVFAMLVPVVSLNGEHAFTREMIRINRASDPGCVWGLRIANAFRVRDGKLTETWVIPEDQYEFDRYWSDAEPTASSRAVLPLPAAHDRRVINLVDAVAPETAAALVEMYRRFWRGDLSALREMFDEDVIVNIVGKSDMSGKYHGWEGFLEFRRKLMDMAGDKYKLDVVAFAASCNDAWATEYIRMNRKWDPAVKAITVQMHFEFRNGKIARMDDFPFDTYAWEQFYTRPLPPIE